VVSNDIICVPSIIGIRPLFQDILTELHAIKAYWESGGIAPLILWPRHEMELSGQLHSPADLPPGKEPLVHIG
jgi:hypothetical protein